MIDATYAVQPEGGWLYGAFVFTSIGCFWWWLRRGEPFTRLLTDDLKRRRRASIWMLIVSWSSAALAGVPAWALILTIVFLLWLMDRSSALAEAMREADYKLEQAERLARDPDTYEAVRAARRAIEEQPERGRLP